MAAELGVCWDSVMAAVREHGEPLVEDPDRVGVVAQLGVDETTVLAANADHPTLFATGMVGLRRPSRKARRRRRASAISRCWRRPVGSAPLS
jgi:hypothetical protein